MRVVIIGSGNVAQIFARMISATKHEVAGIVCRNPEALVASRFSLGTTKFSSFNDKIPTADIYIAAVSDRFLPDLLKQFQPVQGIIVHTAGGVSMSVFNNNRIPYGVLYPLQSLRKETLFMPEIPMLIDGSDPDTLTRIEELAKDLSDKVVRAGDEMRKKLHLSAVYSANFINYILIQTFQYCNTEGLDSKLLLPLLNETIERLNEFDPSEVQTGPAIRNDQTTIDSHLEMLEDFPEMKKFYGIFTDSIKQYYFKQTGERS